MHVEIQLQDTKAIIGDIRLKPVAHGPIKWIYR